MSRTLQPEDVISHYRIIGPLGAGGMGEVYLALDQTLERNVALKILPPRILKDEDRVRRFILEAKSASSLNHPHIVTIYEIGQDEVHPKGGPAETGEGAGAVRFISMELITGETLGSKIHQEKLDLRTLLGYLAQAADGLAKAHAAGIVHRDLKPGNIMVNKDGYAKVLDFGLAKLTEKREADPEITSAPTELKDITGQGVVMGTMGYMSPEQVRGNAVDHRSDIFSFGCVLYEAATRRRPFAADTDVETMHKILNEKPAPVEELNPRVPAEVRRLIRRCLTKNVDQRFQSMKDLSIELREIVDEYDTLSASTGSGSSISSAATAAPVKSRAMTIGIVAAALVAVAGIAFGIYGLRRANASVPQTDASFQSMKVTSLLSDPGVQNAVLSADGRYLAYILAGEGGSSLRVRQVAIGGDVEILKPQEAVISGLAFSPDGDYLYYLYRGYDQEHFNYKALLQVPSLGGAPRKRAFDVDSAVTFSPDGKRICFRRDAPQNKETLLVLLDLNSGGEKILAKLKQPDQFLGHPSWSPDGRRIAVGILTLEKGGTNGIRLFDPESGRQESLGEGHLPFLGEVSWLPDGSGLVSPGSEIGGPGQIWFISYPEGRTRKLTNDQSNYWSLSASKDAKSLAAIRSSSTGNLWAVATTGDEKLRQITRGAGAQSAIWEFHVAEDGTIVFFASNGQSPALYRIDPDGSNRQEISTGQGLVSQPRVIPGGLLYAQSDEDLLDHIWRATLRGENPRRLTEGKGEGIIAVSRDGRSLLFGRWDLPGEIWSMPAEGGDPVRIAEGITNNAATFSPDGNLIRYVTMKQVGELFRGVNVIIPAGGGQPVATLLLPPKAGHVTWTPDSKALAFVQEVGGVQNIYRQPIEGGEPTPITHFKEGSTNGFSWSPDGARLVMNRWIGGVGNYWMTPAGGGEPVQVTDFKTGSVSRHDWGPGAKEIFFTHVEFIQDVVLIRGFRG